MRAEWGRITSSFTKRQKLHDQTSLALGRSLFNCLDGGQLDRYSSAIRS